MWLVILIATLAQVARVGSMPAVEPVIVSRVSAGSSNGIRTVEFDVINNTGQTITAWKVAVEADRSDAKTERSTIANDGYLIFSGLISDRGDVVVPAHGSIRGATTIDASKDVEVLAVRASLRCAIFADGSWSGDRSDAESMFKQRESNYKALTDIVSDLRRARLTAKGVEGLRLALSHLDRIGQDDCDHAYKVTMRRNLQMALSGNRSIKGTPDDLMTHWLLSTEQRWEATSQHRRQGPQLVVK